MKSIINLIKILDILSELNNDELKSMSSYKFNSFISNMIGHIENCNIDVCDNYRVDALLQLVKDSMREILMCLTDYNAEVITKSEEYKIVEDLKKLLEDLEVVEVFTSLSGSMNTVIYDRLVKILDSYEFSESIRDIETKYTLHIIAKQIKNKSEDMSIESATQLIKDLTKMINAIISNTLSFNISMTSLDREILYKVDDCLKYLSLLAYEDSINKDLLNRLDTEFASLLHACDRVTVRNKHYKKILSVENLNIRYMYIIAFMVQEFRVGMSSRTQEECKILLDRINKIKYRIEQTL